LKEKRDITQQLTVDLEDLSSYILDLMGTIPRPVYVVNATGIIEDGNEALEQLTGWSLEELLGERHRVIFAEEATVEEVDKETLEKGYLTGKELMLLTKQGERIPVSMCTRARIDDSGNVSYVATLIDMTEHQRTEEKLRQSDKRYRLLAENAADVIWTVDLNMRLTYISPSVTRLLGYSVEEAMAKGMEEVFTPASFEVAMKALAEELAIENMENKDLPRSRTLELELICKDGSIVPVEINCSFLRDADGRAVEILVIARGISERKRVEEQIKHAAQEWRMTFDSISDLVSIHDKDNKIVRVNRAYADAFNMKPKDLIGKPCYEVVHGTKEPWPHCPHKQTLETKKPAGAEFFEPRLGIYLQVSTSPMFNEKGEVVGSVHVARDITERKQMEERERQMQQELSLSSRLASIGELASGVAHEINNPLTAVIGFSQMLMGRDIPKDIKQDLKIVNDNAQRVAKIVKNLLTFARQRKGAKEYVDINSVVLRVLELRTYEMNLSNIEVITQLAPDLPWTMANTGQLQQVFLNIILNAEQAMTKAHNKGKLSVKTQQIGNNIRASFEDDGPGIARENLDRIFDPFFTTKGVAGGTGLGLSLSYGIIKEHNGGIYARSELGKGATLFVELPIVPEVQQLKLAETVVEEPRRVTGARIMVVDDELAICQFLARVLTQDGHNVETIDNASAALERLERERYNLILVDIRMEGMDGIELYRHMRKIAPSLQRRVVFITGDTMTSGTRNFLDRIKAHCIPKPFDTEQLKRDINQILIESM